MVDLFDPTIRKSAILSPCGTYRYQLERQWGEGAPLCFVMLNPSTADAELDDPTIRRCIGFARREGAGGVLVGNLFALRSTDPAALDGHPDPVGPENTKALGEMLLWSAIGGRPIIAAWGACKKAGAPAARLSERAADIGTTLACLGTTKDGHPRHPLYVRADQPFIPLTVRAKEDR